MDKFLTIKQEATAEISEKKSKFIANIIPVETKEEAENAIKKIKKTNYDARHHCSAYRIIEGNSIVEKSSDDGEPSGTAGAPMLNILQKNELCNVVIIVTRYFGGILLGTGGLVRSYMEATNNAIDKAEIVNKVKGIRYKIKVEYDSQKDVIYWCKKLNINIKNTNYDNYVELELESEYQSKEKLLNNIKIVENCVITGENIYIQEENL